jgi:hypothetical protein
MGRKALLFTLLVLFLAMLACGSGGAIGQPTEQPKLTIISVSQGTSKFGRTQATIHVRNDSSRIVKGVKLHADCYKDGKVIASEWLPAEPYDLNPGQEAIESVRFGEGITCDEIKARATANR